MKLSKESWHYRAYSATFRKQAPDNLCGYFWKAMFAVAFFPFFYIYYKPFEWLIVPQDRAGWEGQKYYSHKFFPALGLWVLIGFAISMVVMFFISKGSVTWSFGLAGWILTGTVLLAIAGSYLQEKVRERRREKRRNALPLVPKEKKEWIIVEYIKAVKEKTCPRIQWVDEYEGISDDQRGV